MKKILLVFGTRPEAIKLAPLILKLRRDNFFDVKVCISAQHREMLDSVLSTYRIIPDYDLSVMKQEQSLSYITERVLSGVSRVIDDCSPDLLLVHGDTSTTFAASLAAFYKKVPIGHVEAGLRSGNIFSPYPEEFNRKAISIIADLHFAPTEIAFKNLIVEGIDQNKIYLSGNTVIDALLLSDGYIPNLPAPTLPFALMTVHRREHSEDEIIDIFRGVRRLCVEHNDVCVIYPVHKSPRILRLSSQILGGVDNIRLIEPLPVKDFHYLLKKCRFVLTDSGGVQEEASFLGKPVLVVRNNTERPEGVESGTLSVIGSEEKEVYENMKKLFFDNRAYGKAAIPCLSFGNGRACDKIIEVLKKI